MSRAVRPAPWELSLPALLVASAAPIVAAWLWLALPPVQPAAVAVTLLFYLVSNAVVFLDLADFVARLIAIRWHGAVGTDRPTSVVLPVGQFTPYQIRLHLRPYAICVSVHEPGEELDDFLEAMAAHRDRLWIIDDASTDDTWFRLQRAGVHCARTAVNRKKPGAIKELVACLPADVATVLVLDPDIRILDRWRDGLSDLDRVVFEFQRSGHAALCPRMTVRPDGWLARCQALEYGMAFRLGRRSLADYTVTSGVALYRRDALAKVLERHSLSVYAEDLRNALILLGEGERIYYDERLAVETEGKRTLRGWFSQRVGWYYGLLKVWAENRHDLVRAARGRRFFWYHYGLYVTLCTLLLHPLRLASIALLTVSAASGADYLLGLQWIPDGPATQPVFFLLAYLKYTVLTLFAAWLVADSRRDWLRSLPTVPVYFFYALAHAAPVTVGYLNWFSVRMTGRRLYRDHYESEPVVRTGALGSK